MDVIRRSFKLAELWRGQRRYEAWMLAGRSREFVNQNVNENELFSSQVDRGNYSVMSMQLKCSNICHQALTAYD